MLETGVARRAGGEDSAQRGFAAGRTALAPASAARERTRAASRPGTDKPTTARSGTETTLSGPRSSLSQRAKRQLRELRVLVAAKPYEPHPPDGDDDEQAERHRPAEDGAGEEGGGHVHESSSGRGSVSSQR